MKIEDYRKGLEKIDQTAREAKGKLAFEYAMLNNPYKKGDIVEDHKEIIRIEESDVRISTDGTPVCVYRGPILKKDWTLRKDGKHGEVWQPNIKDNFIRPEGPDREYFVE